MAIRASRGETLNWGQPYLRGSSEAVAEAICVPWPHNHLPTRRRILEGTIGTMTLTEGLTAVRRSLHRDVGEDSSPSLADTVNRTAASATLRVSSRLRFGPER